MNDNNAVLIRLDQGDLIALAITEAYQREAADLMPDVPVLSASDVDVIGKIFSVLGGKIESARRP